MQNKPKIGVSRCLLGDAVRYDGKSKPCAAIQKLATQFELIAICPEVEAGLSIPRPAVQLSDSIEQPKLIGRDDLSIDITDLMHNYCLKKIPSLNKLKGFVLKSRSPSCGLHNTPVFIDGKCISENSSGVFTRALQNTYSCLALIEDTQLKSTKQINEFIQQVLKSKNRKT